MNEEEMMENAARMMAQSLRDTAALFAPHFPEEHIPALARFLLGEQAEINATIIPDMADPDSDKPHILVQVSPSKGRGDATDATFPALKRIEGVKDGRLVVPQVMVYAFLTSPAARGILRMHGWQYSFAQTKLDDPSQPKILM